MDREQRDPLEAAKARGVERAKELRPMADVIRALRHHDYMMQAQFWLTPNDYLDGATPIQRIVDDASGVLRAAQAFGEQGCA